MTHLNRMYDYSYAQEYLEKCRRSQILANQIIYHDIVPGIPPVPTIDLSKQEPESPDVVVVDDIEDSGKTQIDLVYNTFERAPETNPVVIDLEETTEVEVVPEATDLCITGVDVLREWIDISELPALPKEIHPNVEALENAVNCLNKSTTSKPEEKVKGDSTTTTKAQILKGDSTTTTKAQILEGDSTTTSKATSKAEDDKKTCAMDSDKTEVVPTSEPADHNWADVNVEEEPEDNSFKFRCTHCSYKTNWKGNMTKHVISRHQSLQEIQWYDCAHCPYRGKTKEYLKIHLRQSHEPFVTWHNCPKCPFRAKSSYFLKTHTFSMHTAPEDINWYKCDKCDFKCKFRKQLSRHEINRHKADDEIEWIRCDKCPYRTKTKKGLQRHVYNKHTNVDDINWLECDKCGYLAKGKDHLDNHLKQYHCGPEKMKTREEDCGREWACESCGFRTRNRKEYNAHFKFDGRNYFCS